MLAFYRGSELLEVDGVLRSASRVCKRCQVTTKCKSQNSSPHHPMSHGQLYPQECLLATIPTLPAHTSNVSSAFEPRQLSSMSVSLTASELPKR